ncbi:class I SAM-dependent methyltransferase [Microbacterium ulmi]|uniref:Class I SAM-dependent methyltransferase n=1 Tax=Microbacterium ulmi TaxID=179095 RepID=A0A7Y2M2Z1_9MICO|nr:class I SAM-dependent methyltransferase [Microbacterium ulmi]NII68170.1 SAM-dependent methyltransferase [Microbacterium ulmi]NNH05362.1 class I SAM-dependent methyltransferase [Microbacterium ulmi]
MAERAEMSTSFGRQAGTYEAGRPEYPAEAVAWMLQPVASHDRSVRVADVGAGTGKLTRALVELGAETVAIDPDPEMLAVLRSAVHGIPTFVGTAERLPLPDASLDAVVLGQAWHWVEPVAGSAEVGRVLRHGGVLGLIWNIRDDSVPWVARLTRIMHGSHADQSLADGGPSVASPFGPLEQRSWEWARPMTRAALYDMARSRSYIITAEPDVRARIEAELGVLFDEIGAIGDAVVELPYRTTAFRALREG